ncbi:MAG: Crp/Fnr family transcriptional regulator, partial [Planctomycetota bacterium]
RLEPEQLDWLESRSRMRKFPKGSSIYLPADQSDGVLLLTDGRVKISSITGDGKQSIMTFIEPGDVFGELSIFEGGEREEYAEASESSSVVLIPAHDLRKVVEENPYLAMGITRLVGLRRKRIERRLKYLLFHSNRERLVNLLLELARDFGQRKSPDQVDLRIKLSHQDLASIIGSTRESVTVILGQLQNEGLLQLGRRRISFRNIEKLAASINRPVPHVATSERVAWQSPTRVVGNALL